VSLIPALSIIRTNNEDPELLGSSPVICHVSRNIGMVGEVGASGDRQGDPPEQHLSRLPGVLVVQGGKSIPAQDSVCCLKCMPDKPLHQCSNSKNLTSGNYDSNAVALVVTFIKQGHNAPHYENTKSDSFNG